ncbi:hypothetical protein GpartN1_g5839.t1 [Galdieria partita]|uniref:Uncharacterized protein n=1 Tax=Galdieria partita TaxID=83374 RepID=A0A9C7USP4_9RHOD|nr:hypothetical protein GpartN1_g5839.t1 [Galdieria partita]
MFQIVSFVALHFRSLKVCKCSVCFHVNKQRLKLLHTKPCRKYVAILATFQDSESNTQASQSEPESGHNVKQTKDAQSTSVGAEGVFQVILSILLLYGSLLKRLFYTKEKNPVQEKVWKSSFSQKELENFVTHFSTLPGECREVLYDLWQSLLVLASEKSVESYENTHFRWRKVETNVVEIARQLVRYQQQIEYLKSTLSRIDQITANIAQPVKYLEEFEQEWNPSWSSRRDSLSISQKSKDSIEVVAENSFDSEHCKIVDCNVEETVRKVEKFVNQVIDLSFFLQEVFTKEKIGLHNGHNDVVHSMSTKLASKESFLLDEEIFTSDELLEILSLILPETTLEEIRASISQSPEKERWKQIRSFLTNLTRKDSSLDQSTFEGKEPKYHISTNYQNMSKDELIQEVKTRDSQIVALEEQISQAATKRKQSLRKSSKTETPERSKKRRPRTDKSATKSKKSLN